MRLKLESSTCYCSQRACCNIKHNTPKAEGMSKRIDKWMMGADMSTSLLEIWADMRHVEKLEC